MALCDDNFYSEWMQFKNYMNGTNLVNPNEVSYWRRYQNFALRRPNRVIKAIQYNMFEKCIDSGNLIFENEKFIKKPFRRFHSEEEVDQFCRKQVHEISKMKFQWLYDEFMVCCDNAEGIHPGFTYYSYARLQFLKGKCFRKYELDTHPHKHDLVAGYTPIFPPPKTESVSSSNNDQNFN